MYCLNCTLYQMVAYRFDYTNDKTVTRDTSKSLFYFPYIIYRLISELLMTQL
jgi:hypothetical protein